MEHDLTQSRRDLTEIISRVSAMEPEFRATQQKDDKGNSDDRKDPNDAEMEAINPLRPDVNNILEHLSALP